MNSPAEADNECGVDGVGSDTLTCTAAAYPAGIRYNNSNGLTLVLDNAAMDIDSTVFLRGLAASNAGISINAALFDRIDFANGYGLEVNHNGTGAASVSMMSGVVAARGGLWTQINNAAAPAGATARATMTGGEINFTGISFHRGIFAENRGAGDARVEISGGTITAIGTGGVGILARNSGTGATTIVVSGGRITPGQSRGVHAQITSAANAADSTITMSAGHVETSGSGLRADTNGSGLASVSFSGGLVKTTAGGIGIQVFNGGTGAAVVTVAGGRIEMNAGTGAVAQVANGASTASATALMTDGEIDIARGGIGLQALQSGLGTGLAEMRGGRLTDANLYARASNTANASTLTALMSGGTINLSQNNQRAVYALHAGTGQTDVRMTGGVITGTGTGTRALFANSQNAASLGTSVVMDGGTINLSGDQSYGALAYSTGPGPVSVVMNGGSITLEGGDGFGLAANTASLNPAASSAVTVNGGRVSVEGSGSHGIFVSNASSGTYAVTVNGGTIEGGSGDGTAILTEGSGTGTVVIGTNGIVDGARSGVAFRDGSEPVHTGSTTLTNRGTVTGDLLMGLGNDTVNLAGGSLRGSIQLGDGNDSFNWTGGALTGSVFGGNGADQFTISGTSPYDGSTLLDGGNEPGVNDILTLNGVTTSLSGSRLLNFERIALQGGTVSLADTVLSTGSGSGLGLHVTAGATARLSGQVTIAGDLTNGAVIDMQNSLAGDRLTVTGDYTGGGVILIDVDLMQDRHDALVFGGNLAGGKTDVHTRLTGAMKKTGRLKIISAEGKPLADHFTFHAPGATDALVLSMTVDRQGVYLEPTYGPAAPVYESYLPALALASRMPSLNHRLGARLGGETGGGIMIQGDGDGDFVDDPEASGETGRLPVWLSVGGGRSLSTAGSGSTGASMVGQSWQLRLGTDATLSDTEKGRLELGLSGQYDEVLSHMRLGTASGQSHVRGGGFGASATWYAASGFYLDGQLQAALFTSALSSAVYGRLVDDNRGFALSASLEAGQRFEWAEGLSSTLEAQLTLSHLGFAAFTGPLGDRIEPGLQAQALARLGGQIEKTHVFAVDSGKVYRAKAYGLANLYHRFGPSLMTTVGGVELSGANDRWRGELGLGGNFGRNDDSLSVFGEMAINAALADPAHNFSLTGRLGLKLAF